MTGRRPGGTAVIGLVNNMPDAALHHTERQFRDLLAGAAGGAPVALHLFSLPSVPRGDAARAHLAAQYRPLAALFADGVDGLIVTGAEPRTAALADEPYWRDLARLIDWAEAEAVPAIWSCLAAHAAVWHLDGIGRTPFAAKLSGVFECAKVADHPLLAGAALPWHIPHSRHNGLAAADLVACGYRVLTRAPVAGVDCFVRERRGRFVFVQGHPEYDDAALLREYRRDVGRWLGGRRDAYPELPQNYFDARAAAALAAFRQRAQQRRDPAALDDFPVIAPAGLAGGWREPARRFYANWLASLRQTAAAL